MPEIRMAKEGDFPALAALEYLSFSQPWSEAAFRSFQESGGIILTAAEQGPVLGYITAVIAADEGEIANIAVAAECRRQGVGGALLSALEEEAARRGVRALFLEVRLSNLPAQKLYEKAGYSVVGRRKNFYALPTEDALIYRKELLKQ